MTILVTGAAGFIGSHLSERLLATGNRVIGLDCFDTYYDPLQKERNLEVCLQDPGFTLVRGDIRDAQKVGEIFAAQPIDAVIHLAARAGVRPSIEQAELYTAVNLDGTTVLLEAARRNHVRRFLFASSSSVYGNQVKTPFSETDDVGFPISPYAATKRSGELLCHVYHHLYGLEIACMRFFTVYGPRQRPDLAIHKFIHLALQGKPIPLYGDGSSRRDYTFIDDIVDGVTALLHVPGLGYDIFNLGNGQPVRLLDMVHALERALGRAISVEWLDKQPGDVDQTHADVAKARTAFGYQPRVGLDEGVSRFLEWYRSEGAQ